MDQLIVQQTESFYRRFYRFPDYLTINGQVVTRERIVSTIEKYLNGRKLEWFRRRKLIGQLQDAKRVLGG